MLKPDEYQAMYDSLVARCARLINTPAQVSGLPSDAVAPVFYGRLRAVLGGDGRL
jgi:hypothetical protein